MNLPTLLARFCDIAQHRTHSEAASQDPRKTVQVGGGVQFIYQLLESLLTPASGFSQRLSPQVLFSLSHTRNAETLTYRGPGRSLPDVIQLPIQCPHGVPFPIHYLAATAAVEFSFCFDTLGLHHLSRGEH